MQITKEKIIKLLKKADASPAFIAQKLNLSRQIIHRHLQDLEQSGLIAKKGQSPKVQYFIMPKESRIFESVNAVESLLSKYEVRLKQVLNFWKVPNKQTVDLHFLLQTSVLFSSKIEGNTLDLNSFLNKAEIPRAKKRELQEIKDLQNAYEFAREHSLTEQNFLQAHKILSKTFLSPGARGTYRKDKVGVFGSRGLEYMALEASLVQGEMSALFALVSKLLERKMKREEVYVWSMYLHVMIALIHPFADGNGRVARLIEKWFLAEKLGGKYWYIESERFYFENLKKYYASLSLGVNYWEVDFKKMKKFFELHM